MVSVRTPQRSELPRLSPLGAGRCETRFTIEPAAREAIRCFEQLTGRQVTSPEMSEALAEGFQRKAAALEKRRFGLTDKPRKQSKPARGRRIPNLVKRQIWRRDEGRCTFVSENGRRRERRGDVEFDHIEPVARGGESSVGNLRLRCRAHNQYEAERTFGAGFMHQKRERARKAADRRGRTPATPVAAPAAPPVPAKRPAPLAEPPSEQEVTDIIPCLRRLGFRVEEARQAAAYSESMKGTSLEARVRVALSFLAPRAGVRRLAIGAASTPATRGGASTARR